MLKNCTETHYQQKYPATLQKSSGKWDGLSKCPFIAIFALILNIYVHIWSNIDSMFCVKFLFSQKSLPFLDRQNSSKNKNNGPSLSLLLDDIIVDTNQKTKHINTYKEQLVFLLHCAIHAHSPHDANVNKIINLCYVRALPFLRKESNTAKCKEAMLNGHQIQLSAWTGCQISAISSLFHSKQN